MKKISTARKEITATCVARIETIHGTHYRFQAGENAFRTYLTNRKAEVLTIGEQYKISPDADSKVMFCDIHEIKISQL
jgi:hypothetical protein